MNERRIRAAVRNGRPDWYKIRNAADGEDAGTAEILIYDEIGWSFWDDTLTAGNFVRELAELDAAAITVRINSPGGDVFDGIAILNALRSHHARITTVIDGLAASAASFIAMAGDEIVMQPNAEMMIHDAWGLAIGNADDMRTMAELLDRDSNNIARIYAERAGGTVEEWRAAMREETWYSDQEAVDAGLADRIEKPAKGGDSTSKASFDLSIFTHAGRTAAPAPFMPAARRSVAAARAPRNSSAAEVEASRKEGTMPTLMEGLAERLGIPADADEDTALQALDEALAERADDTAADTPPAEPTVEQLAPIAARHGLAVVDRAQYEATVADAAAGRAAREQQLTESDERAVDGAIRAGKIAPARRAHWLAALKADRDGATATLNSLADGLVPLAEIGHGQTGATPDADLSWFGETSSKGA